MPTKIHSEPGVVVMKGTLHRSGTITPLLNAVNCHTLDTRLRGVCPLFVRDGQHILIPVDNMS